MEIRTEHNFGIPLFNTYFCQYSERVSECGSVVSVASLSSDGAALKKKLSHYGEQGTEDDRESQKAKHSAQWNKRQNHSEIEKRRRDKMNTYIYELSRIIPQCRARKLDKLSVLRLAVQHFRMLRGALPSYCEGHYKPSFLPDVHLQQLLLHQSSDAFLFVVSCDRGRILFVSDSVSNTLHYSPSKLLGSSWFDILHPQDLAKVKEQLSCADISHRERLVDAKTLLPVHQSIGKGGTAAGGGGRMVQPSQDLNCMCPGSRRAFWCRMRDYNIQQVPQKEADSSTEQQDQLKEEACPLSQSSPSPGTVRFTPGLAACVPGACDRRYTTVHFVGYLKIWTSSESAQDNEGDSTDGSKNIACLVAVGRMLQAHSEATVVSAAPVTGNFFQAKLTSDAKFLYVDPHVTLVLGWLPQELTGQNLYELCVQSDTGPLSVYHRTLLSNGHLSHPISYRCRHQNGSTVQLQSWWSLFWNPWTNDLEYILTRSSVIMDNEADFVESSTKLSMQIPTAGVGEHNVCESVLEADGTIIHPGSAITGNSSQCGCESGDGGTAVGSASSRAPRRESETSGPAETTNDSDEAAMAVIMSLLEADAGLGGPVDFSHLPWPLP